MIAKNSAGPVDTITFFAEAPSHVYELTRQTNPLLQPLLFISKQVVPRESSARPLSEIARPQYNDIANPGKGRAIRSLPCLLFTRC